MCKTDVDVESMVDAIKYSQRILDAINERCTDGYKLISQSDLASCLVSLAGVGVILTKDDITVNHHYRKDTNCLNMVLEFNICERPVRIGDGKVLISNNGENVSIELTGCEVSVPNPDVSLHLNALKENLVDHLYNLLHEYVIENIDILSSNPHGLKTVLVYTPDEILFSNSFE